jgi:hypothetical protein
MRKHRSEDGIKIGLKEIISDGVNWIHLAQEEIIAGRMNIVMNLEFHKLGKIFSLTRQLLASEKGLLLPLPGMCRHMCMCTRVSSSCEGFLSK